MNRHAQIAQRTEVASASEPRPREQHPQIGAWPIDEPFPALLTDADLRRVLGIGWTTFYRLKRLQRFRSLIADPVLTPTVRYSGFKVRAWVEGDSHRRSLTGPKLVRQHGRAAK